MLRQDLPPSQDLDTALATTSSERERRKHDINWVRVEPVVDLGHGLVRAASRHEPAASSPYVCPPDPGDGLFQEP